MTEPHSFRAQSGERPLWILPKATQQDTIACLNRSHTELQATELGKRARHPPFILPSTKRGAHGVHMGSSSMWRERRVGSL